MISWYAGTDVDVFTYITWPDNPLLHNVTRQFIRLVHLSQRLFGLNYKYWWSNHMPAVIIRIMLKCNDWNFIIMYHIQQTKILSKQFTLMHKLRFIIFKIVPYRPTYVQWYLGVLHQWKWRNLNLTRVLRQYSWLTSWQPKMAPNVQTSKNYWISLGNSLLFIRNALNKECKHGFGR